MKTLYYSSRTCLIIITFSRTAVKRARIISLPRPWRPCFPLCRVVRWLVGLSARLNKNNLTDFHEIWMADGISILLKIKERNPVHLDGYTDVGTVQHLSTSLSILFRAATIHYFH